MQKIILERKIEMLKIKAHAISRNERLRLLKSILFQSFIYYKPDLNKRTPRNKFNKRNYTCTKDYILNSYWLKKILLTVLFAVYRVIPFFSLVGIV